MAENNPTRVNVKLKLVRASYLHVFKKHAVNEGDDPKFSMNAIFDKEEHERILKTLKRTMDKMAKAAFSGKIPSSLKLCLRDGDEYADKDGYGDEKMFMTLSSDRRPMVVGRDKGVLAEEDDIIFSGCYVNISAQLWVQDNKWGKRINASLRAVQYVKDGEAFGADPVDVDEEFTDLDDGDDDDDGGGSGLL